ncbi:MAG TPA: DUF177 domain-containing protein [Xanthobacteraceae bacterium]|jgi:uncharacterized metal-binding protein YceD (DUF177 family)
MKKDSRSWSYAISVSDLSPDGIELTLAPNKEVRAELARQAGVLAVPELVAKLKVSPDGHGGAEVEGRLEAAVRQTCIVSLDPFDNKVSEPIEIRFAPASAARPAGGTIDVGLENPPDPLVDGAIDLAAVVAEYLTLAIDPYPRKPGAVFKPPKQARDKGESPFAALKKLKPRRSKA